MASGVLPLVRSYSGTFQVLTGGAFVYRSYGLVAAGRTTQVQGFAARISGVTLRAFGGATARVKLPPLKISASGIFEAVARAAIRLPKLRLAARGTVPYLAQARFKFASYDVVARTGAVAKLKFSGFSMAARGSAGSVGAAHLRYGTFKLLARATQENVRQRRNAAAEGDHAHAVRGHHGPAAVLPASLYRADGRCRAEHLRYQRQHRCGHSDTLNSPLTTCCGSVTAFSACGAMVSTS